MESVITPTLLAAFAAGALSFLSPCVLPLVPGYLSMASGVSTHNLDSPGAADRARLLTNSLLFVIGFTMVFIVYGAVASAIGSLVYDYRLVLTRISGVVIVLMGLVVAGVFRPVALMGERRLHLSPNRLGPYAAPVMGMAFAFGWTPCVGPVLAAVLTLAAGRETLTEGVTLLAAYSLGLGVPFVLAGVAFGRFRSTWQWLKRRGRLVDLVSGAVLVGFGLLLLSGQIGRLSGFMISFFEWFGVTTVLG